MKKVDYTFFVPARSGIQNKVIQKKHVLKNFEDVPAFFTRLYCGWFFKMFQEFISLIFLLVSLVLNFCIRKPRSVNEINIGIYVDIYVSF